MTRSLCLLAACLAAAVLLASAPATSPAQSKEGTKAEKKKDKGKKKGETKAEKKAKEASGKKLIIVQDGNDATKDRVVILVFEGGLTHKELEIPNGVRDGNKVTYKGWAMRLRRNTRGGSDVYTHGSRASLDRIDYLTVEVASGIPIEYAELKKEKKKKK